LAGIFHVSGVSFRKLSGIIVDCWATRLCLDEHGSCAAFRLSGSCSNYFGALLYLVLENVYSNSNLNKAV